MQSHLPHVDFHFVPAGTSENLRVSFDRWNELLDEHTVPFRGFALARTDAPVSPLRGIDPRLMLSGLGGNYTVSLEAYPSCYFAQLAVQLRWSRLARELSGHARFYGATTKHRLKYRVLLPLLGRPAGGTADSRRLLLEYLSPDFVNRAGIREKLSAAGPHWQRRDFNVRRSMAWILDALMPQNVGAAGAVIGRNFTCVHAAPLMSWRLNTFCLALPLEQQIRDGRDRLMLRHAMKGLLPPEVIWRKTRGFSTPDAWPAARAIVAALPGVLGELETSALAGRYLRGLHRIARGEESLLRRLGPNRIIDLFNVAWFLRWLERHPV
jgi:asparagine synthase (glutamine-hydrolysing)